MNRDEVVTLYSDKFYARRSAPDARGCRRWTSCTDDAGYGLFQFRHNGRKMKVRAHHAAFILAGHQIPLGMVLRHSCDNPSCVEVSHLQLGTHADNVQDRVDRDRSACGERNGRAVLSDDDVRNIRQSAVNFLREQSAKYGVDDRAIRAVLAQETWARVG